MDRILVAFKNTHNFTFVGPKYGNQEGMMSVTSVLASVVVLERTHSGAQNTGYFLELESEGT
jgi:hypothetical protein